jgi:lipoprotein-anchoring transpeptidase ErfK/SrfK
MPGLSLESRVNRAFATLSLLATLALAACGFAGASQAGTASKTPTPIYGSARASAQATAGPTLTPFQPIQWTPTSTQTPSPTPCPPIKKIVVDLSEQMIYAVIDRCDEREFINDSFVSTGKPGYETPIGEYAIWIKLESARMTGPGYDDPDVPYTMYFTEWGHAIHGADWHHDFGTAVSHGCVNLPYFPSDDALHGIDEAEWFFNWAEVGTIVIVQP